MSKKIFAAIFTLLLIFLSFGYYYLFKNGLLDKVPEKSIEFIEKSTGREIITSGPLIKDEDDENSFLSINGVIAETNRNRREAGLPELKESATLNVSAQRKADDMFRRQYFEHDAPTGEGVGDLVNETGYEFIVVGENLALGNYQNDKTLVQAWMDSPGHRENILKASYTEIGVAVAKGTYNGKETWMAVQHFAKPLSACPAVSDVLKAQIDSNNAQLDTMKADLNQKKEELEDNKPTNHEEGIEYNKKVDEYNELVNRYNAMLNTTKSIISQYNSQVGAFNSCAKS